MVYSDIMSAIDFYEVLLRSGINILSVSDDIVPHIKYLYGLPVVISKYKVQTLNDLLE